MTLQMLNIDLLDKTMNYIIEHPEEHDQGMWRCGTSRCFAGWACTLDGAVPEIPEDYLPYWKINWRSEMSDGERTRERFIEYYTTTAYGYGPSRAAEMADALYPNKSDTVIPPGLTAQEKTDIASYARQALGLDSRSADILFAGENSLRGLAGMVRFLKEEGTLVGSEWDDEAEDEDSDYCCEECDGY